jgi:pimeloyl-ACP methyl ester carboxylesterase/predicted glycosyltransferase
VRPIEPLRTGFVERDGVRTCYDVHGDGEPAVLLMPGWSIGHSRLWKAQIPYLARTSRVVSFDGRGNGRSDRPRGAAAYLTREYLADALAVVQASGVGRIVPVGVSFGGHLAACFAARHPELCAGAVLIAPTTPFGPPNPHISPEKFQAGQASGEGWARYNRHYWMRDHPGFAAFFFAQALCEPHSTKPIEDCVAWALETTPETLVDTILARFTPQEEDEALYRAVRCPVLVLHGDQDRIVPPARGRLAAELTGATLVTMEGSGHLPLARDPVRVNLLLRRFLDTVAGRVRAPTTVRRGLGRQRRVLYLSSPIGLGHARRDLAIARELRALVPGLEIDWLTQHPVTALLERAGERVHPASRLLANESAQFESVAGEHELNAFQALRGMDEILVANFMVFQEVVEGGDYDLVVADEAWDVDHFWHEHPELKRTALAWLTDFVGYLPMPEGGAREAELTADYNAEMVEHVARFPRVRDRAIFVGEPGDIVPDAFGPSLPAIRDWTEAHFDFCGYVGESRPDLPGERDGLRSRLGYAAGERVCVVAVGGSGAGVHLLRRVIAAAPAMRRRVPGLRTMAVAGPRIDAAALPRNDAVEVAGFAPDLPERLAGCDVAIVQGGLTTCMELAAAGTPFVYVPLRRHFEQARHVRHRLERHGVGRHMDYASLDAERLADAVAELLDRPPGPGQVPADGASRAARMLAELL